MTVLVTGASGFVGSAVIRELLAAGEDVRALVRSESDLRNLAGLKVETVTGDITHVDTLPAAVADCDAVFHVAADYRLWVPDPDAMYETNVQGSLHVIEAAAHAGVRRIVYTSSVATLGSNADSSPADENTLVTLDDMIGHYKRSKYLAEEATRARAAELGLDLVTVNPSTPVGPGDLKPTPTGRLIIDAATGRIPAYVDTGLNIVHVDDVARGHLQALHSGQPGERYILGGENLALREILALVASAAGRRGSVMRLPHWSVLPVAHVSEAWGRLTGSEPRVSVDGARMSAKHMYYSSGKAERELGYRARPAEEAIKAALGWFRDRNYL